MLNTEYHLMRSGNFLLVSVQNPYNFSPEEIDDAQNSVRERIKDPNVFLILNRVTPDGYRSYDEFFREPMEHNKQRWEEE